MISRWQEVIGLRRNALVSRPTVFLSENPSSNRHIFPVKVIKPFVKLFSKTKPHKPTVCPFSVVFGGKHVGMFIFCTLC